MKKYCLGFVCDVHRQEVLLIEKNRPTWQAGKFNGIGGKLEGEESALEAMIRECQEETGLEEIAWDMVGKMEDEEHFHVSVFLGVGELSSAQSLTDEAVRIVSWEEVSHLPLVKDVGLIWKHLLLELKNRSDSNLNDSNNSNSSEVTLGHP